MAHGDDRKIFERDGRKLIKILFYKRRCELSDAVLAIIEKDHGIAILDFFIFRKTDGRQIFFGSAIRVRCLDDRRWVGHDIARLPGECLVGGLRELPVFIAIHGVITTNQCGEILLRDLFKESLHRMRGAILCVGKKMEIDLFNIFFMRHLEERLKMVKGWVNVRFSEEPCEVDRSAGLARMRKSGFERRTLEKTAIFDGHGYFREILIYHFACAKRQMSYLTVAYLSPWKANRDSRCLKARHGIIHSQPFK